MKKWLISIFLIGSFITAQAHKVEVTDDVGNIIRLDKPARRIVALAPHVSENLFAAGAGKYVVGVVDYSDYPKEVLSIPHVGGYSRVDMEAVIALKPDLIVGWQSGNRTPIIEKLKSLGFTVYLSQPDKIDDIADELDRLGQLADTSKEATKAATDFRQRLTNIRQRYSKLQPITVFYQMWNKPLTTVGGKQIISDMIRGCSGENVFANVDSVSVKVNLESVLAVKPQAIIASGMDVARPEWLDDWKQWKQMPAVAADNLFYVSPHIMQRHMPRMLDGMEALCKHLETARINLKKK